MAPDKWFVLTVRPPSEEAAAEFAEALIALGGTAVEEERGRLTTYLPPPADPDRFVRDARDRLRDLAPGTPAELRWEWRENEDWSEAWRRGLTPRRVGRRLIVAPSWTEPEPRPGDVVLRIDPQMAFGTGEHASTRGVLRLLEAEIRTGDRVLDVGAGSGILAIAAALLGAGDVLAAECDADAVANARENLERNGVAGRVELVERRVDDAFLDALGPGRFELIVANVLSGVLVPLLPSFRRSVGDRPPARRPGRLILGGILAREARDVVAAAMRAGFGAIAEDVEEEWWSAAFEARGHPG